jgi:hypothetical protein
VSLDEGSVDFCVFSSGECRQQLDGRISSSLPRVRRSDCLRVPPLKEARGPMSSMRLPADRCVIRLWRGYVKAQFYVPRRDSGDVFCYSPMFATWRAPWRKSIEICDDPAALNALAALEEDLWEKGWERTRRAPGAEWYELRFRPATSASRPPAASHLRRVTSRPDHSNEVDARVRVSSRLLARLRRGRSAGSAVSAIRSDPPRSTRGRNRRTSSV